MKSAGKVLFSCNIKLDVSLSLFSFTPKINPELRHSGPHRLRYKKDTKKPPANERFLARCIKKIKVILLHFLAF